MPPPGNRFIVPHVEVWGDEQIRGAPVARLSDFDMMSTNSLVLLRWCARRRLILNSMPCDVCHGNCTLGRHTQNRDGYRWQCRSCNFFRSIRSRSFFENSHLSIGQILMIIYCWSKEMPQCLTKHKAAVGNSGVIVNWFNFIREECERWLEAHPQQIGGFDANGDSIIVEIDESKYFHRKYHRGQWRDGHWVFGGIERGTGNCFLVEVPDRTTDTLFPLIERYILPGSYIMSDGWRAYGDIEGINDGIYRHSVIVHQRNFVDPNDRTIHTQSVENLWMRAKRKLRWQFGTSHALFPSYLHEFMFRNRFRGEDIFNVFLSILAEHYN